GDGPFGGHCVPAVIPRRRHPNYGYYWTSGGVRLLSSVRSLPTSRSGWIDASLGGDLAARGPGYVCLGCGSVTPGGWLSDASNAGTARGLRIVTRHLPAPEGCRLGAFGCARCPVRFAVLSLRGSRTRPIDTRSWGWEIELVPQAEHGRSITQHRQVAAALSAGRRTDLRHRWQQGDRAWQRRDLLQQLHPNCRPSGLRPVGQHADGGRQRHPEG